MDFKDRLKTALSKRGISQSQLAAVIGVDRSLICHYCSGRCVPKGENLEKMARVLRVTPSYLLGTEEETPMSDDKRFLLNMIENLTDEECANARQYAQFLIANRKK